MTYELPPIAKPPDRPTLEKIHRGALRCARSVGRRPDQRGSADPRGDNFYVSTSGIFSDQALIGAMLTIGADRILFACDYPYEVMESAARWIERAAISEGDRKKIAAGNARRLFKLV